MKICVAGLGIIGGSTCLSLKRAGYAADGWNRSRQALSYALENGVIDGEAEDFSAYDVVFVALPPEATCKFIDTVSFKEGAYVYDVCGVKTVVERTYLSAPRNFFYVGTHPMAGKEISGIGAACADLFDGASIVITINDGTDEGALSTIRRFSEEMGFGYIVECSAEIHDRKIAYTSQLAHVVSNAYIKNPESDGCLGFTGGSFQDMTRIAGVDENMWASLYLANGENISQKIESLIFSLGEIKDAIDNKDEENLKNILKEGRLLFDKSKKTVQNSGIFVKKLR